MTVRLEDESAVSASFHGAEGLGFIAWAVAILHNGNGKIELT